MQKLFVAVRVAIFVILLFGSYAPVFAMEVKTMECERRGLDKDRSIFTFTYYVGTGKLGTRLKSGEWGVPESSDWTVIWRSPDNLHVIAWVAVSQQSWPSPIIVIELDYKNVELKQIGMGGYQSGTFGNSDCRRLD